jgi:hypothetical protein
VRRAIATGWEGFEICSLAPALRGATPVCSNSFTRDGAVKITTSIARSSTILVAFSLAGCGLHNERPKFGAAQRRRRFDVPGIGHNAGIRQLRRLPREHRQVGCAKYRTCDRQIIDSYPNEA